MKAYTDWDWEEAEAAFRRAIELNPNSPDVRAVYALFLGIIKRPNEALEQSERAMVLDRFGELIQSWRGWVLYLARRYDDATLQFQRVLRTAPTHAGALYGLHLAYYAKGMYDESLAAAQSYFSVIGTPEAEEALALGNAEGGYRGAMRRLADTLATLQNVRYVSPADIAVPYVIAGENSQALDWLERGLEERDSQMPWVNVQPVYDPLRETPRFQDLRRRMGLPQ